MRFFVAFAAVCCALALPSRGLAAASSLCGPLPPPGGDVVTVSTVTQLVNAVNAAVPGRTILVADGTYSLNGQYLRIDDPNVTVRGQSGNRDAVILDGNYLTTEIFQIVASNVTIADLTLREAYDHPIHVMASGSHVLDTLIYDVHVIDPGQQAIKVNPTAGEAYYVDHGTVACSRIELTDAGRSLIRDNCYTGGIDVHAGVGWTVRDNEIDGFWCPVGLSEHAVHFWNNARDTRVERNSLRNNARGVGFGMKVSEPSPSRTYSDDPCPAAGGGYVDHYGGSVRNNMVAADDAGLFASEYGFDCGICFWQACGAEALHNTVYSANPGQSFSSIEWRFAHTQVDLVDNLVNLTMRARDGAAAISSGNLTTAQASWFAAPLAGDLHLTTAASAAIDQGVSSALSDDFDGEARPRGVAPDVGADETGMPALSIDDVSVIEGN